MLCRACLGIQIVQGFVESLPRFQICETRSDLCTCSQENFDPCIARTYDWIAKPSELLTDFSNPESAFFVFQILKAESVRCGGAQCSQLRLTDSCDNRECSLVLSVAMIITHGLGQVSLLNSCGYKIPRAKLLRSILLST